MRIPLLIIPKVDFFPLMAPRQKMGKWNYNKYRGELISETTTSESYFPKIATGNKQHINGFKTADEEVILR
jgi:hypothetical protein